MFLYGNILAYLHVKKIFIYEFLSMFLSVNQEQGSGKIASAERYKRKTPAQWPELLLAFQHIVFCD
jgi:hypothetical protein